MRQKALMWQAGVVPGGGDDSARNSTGGAIVAAGMNLLTNYFTASGAEGVVAPEAAWLLYSLLGYAYTSPRPAKRLQARVTKCAGCIPDVNVNLCPADA